MKEVLRRYTRDYEEKFSDLAFSLASAAVARMGTLSELPQTALSGGQIVYYKKFVGPNPASEAAIFLDFLSNKLPN